MTSNVYELILIIEDIIVAIQQLIDFFMTATGPGEFFPLIHEIFSGAHQFFRFAIDRKWYENFLTPAGKMTNYWIASLTRKMAERSEAKSAKRSIVSKKTLVLILRSPIFSENKAT
jgi:hypothetical protein